MKVPRTINVLFLSCFAASLLVAEEKQPIIETPPSPMDWLTGSTIKGDIRPRYEFGDQEGRDSSHAGTLRARLGLLSGTVTADRESYQAASVHGLGQNKTVIADPESHELNQLWLNFDGWIPKSTVKVGRQGINLDGQRYVGTVAWRQNMQTFDAVTINSKPMDELTMIYGYFNHVDRIFGSAAYTGLPFGKLTVFGYFFDLGNDAGDANSNQSFGASLAGPLFSEVLKYYAEYGYQTDAFDSPLDYGANYFHVNVSASAKPGTAVLGYEYLGTDNGVGYKFPLATLHKFNGFADNFLATPAGGLQDAYVSLGTNLPFGFKGTLVYHKFLSASGGNDLGDEVDAVLVKKLSENLTLLSKYAYFFSDDSPDIQRAVIQLDYKF